MDLAAPFKLRPVVQSLLGLRCRYVALQSCLWPCLPEGLWTYIVVFSSALSLALSYLVPDWAPWRGRGPGSSLHYSQTPFPAQSTTWHVKNHTLSVGIPSVLGWPLTPGLSSLVEQLVLASWVWVHMSILFWWPAWGGYISSSEESRLRKLKILHVDSQGNGIQLCAPQCSTGVDILEQVREIHKDCLGD